jgi:hypothetical protein
VKNEGYLSRGRDPGGRWIREVASAPWRTISGAIVPIGGPGGLGVDPMLWQPADHTGTHTLSLAPHDARSVVLQAGEAGAATAP